MILILILVVVHILEPVAATAMIILLLLLLLWGAALSQSFIHTHQIRHQIAIAVPYCILCRTVVVVATIYNPCGIGSAVAIVANYVNVVVVVAPVCSCVCVVIAVIIEKGGCRRC